MEFYYSSALEITRLMNNPNNYLNRVTFKVVLKEVVLTVSLISGLQIYYDSVSCPNRLSFH